MIGPEIHPAVDAGKMQAKCNAEAFSEATKRAVASATALAEVAKRHKRKRATLALLLRVVVGIALAFLTVMAKKYGLMQWELSGFILCAISCWLTMWVGAWVQFMWCKEGVLR